MNIQVLVATMDQRDLSLARRMNIDCDAIIANQTDRDAIEREESDHGKVTMISTRTRGVGLNRNIALMAAEADIVLFADDDIRYYGSVSQGVMKAFDECPKADVIAFSVDIEKGGKIVQKCRWKKQRRTMFNSLRFGTYVLAARRSSLLRENITFNTLFGGGCIYGSGEDSKLILDCLRAGLKLYSHPYVLGRCSKDSSTWFHGYDRKFFYDKGAWAALTMRRMKHMVKWYYMLRFRRLADIPLSEMWRQMDRGMKNASKAIPYVEE